MRPESGHIGMICCDIEAVVCGIASILYDAASTWLRHRKRSLRYRNRWLRHRRHSLRCRNRSFAASQAFFAISQPSFAASQAFFAISQPFFAASQPFFAASQPMLANSQPRIAASQPLLAKSQPLIPPYYRLNPSAAAFSAGDGTSRELRKLRMGPHLRFSAARKLLTDRVLLASYFGVRRQLRVIRIISVSRPFEILTRRRGERGAVPPAISAAAREVVS
jgi:hypothetical protein